MLLFGICLINASYILEVVGGHLMQFHFDYLFEFWMQGTLNQLPEFVIIII